LGHHRKEAFVGKWRFISMEVAFHLD
jgi:hypothetical protein